MPYQSASVAQWTEHNDTNVMVRGSNPLGGSIYADEVLMNTRLVVDQE